LQDDLGEWIRNYNEERPVRFGAASSTVTTEAPHSGGRSGLRRKARDHQESCVRGHSEEKREEPAMAIKKDVLDELLAGADGKDVFGKNGLFDALKKALAERMLNAEMDHHLIPFPYQNDLTM
jgi:hypothetical protein